MFCDDCGREMLRKGDYSPPVWKCYQCNIEIEEDTEDEFIDKQTTFDNDNGEQI